MKKNVREMGGNARTWKVEERVQSWFIQMRAHAVFNSITTSIFVVQLFLILLRLVGCSGFRFSVFVFFFISALLYVNVNAINLITISPAAVTILLLLINGFCNHFTCLCLAFFYTPFLFSFRICVGGAGSRSLFNIFGQVVLYCLFCFGLLLSWIRSFTMYSLFVFKSV